MAKKQKFMNGKKVNGKRPYFLADEVEPEADKVADEPDAQPDASYGDTRRGTKAKGKDTSKKTTMSKEGLDELVTRMRDEYEAGWNKDRDNQDEAYRDLRLIGDDRTEHWDPAALSQRTNDGRPALVVNQCPQFVRQVTGDLRQLKPAIKVTPITDSASKEVASKILPGMIRYIEQRSKAQHIYFNAADQQAGCGIGHWRVNHEYVSTNTFNQEIRIEPIPDGVAVVWDPDAVLPDRSDAKFCFVPVDISRRIFKRKYPDASPDSLNPTIPTCFTSWYSDDHVRIAEWFYVDPEMKRLAVYPDGKIDDVTDDAEAEQVAIRARAEIEEREGQCVYRALTTANEIIEGPEKWPGPDIPIVPLIGEEVQIGRATVRRGVVRCLRDVQRIYNYGISTKTEVLALQPKSPWLGTREQFEKYQDQWETANERNHPYLEYTHVPGVPMPSRSSPSVNTQSLDGLLVETQGAMNSTTGIYPAALGAKSNETSGTAIRARQTEGDTGTYVYVSNFASAIQRTGQIIVNMIPQIYDTKRTIQITGEDGKIDEMPINQPGFDQEGMGPGIALNDVTIGAYQVAIEMGPSFSSKREEARDGMNELMRTLGPQGSMMFIDLLVKQMDWPLADKIAERAKFMLPPAIQAKEAAESGEPPPPPPPPQPPTPEQQKAMEIEQTKAQEATQANIELARKNEIADRQLAFDTAKMQFEQSTMPALAQLQEALLQEKNKNLDLASEMKRVEVANDITLGKLQFQILELQRGQQCEEDAEAMAEKVQGNIEKARENQLKEDGHHLERRKIALEHHKVMHGGHADAQSAQVAQDEQAQANIEQARKNQIADRQAATDAAKLDMERATMPALAQLQKALQQAQEQNATLAAQIERNDVNHEVAMGKMEFQILDLQHQLGDKAEKSDAQLAEELQGNIERARTNELADAQLAHDKRKMGLEEHKLRQGFHADQKAAQDAQAEQVQANIEKARANELAERQHGFAVKDLGFKEKQSERAHDLAMNPPPEPKSEAKAEAAPKAQEAPQQATPADDTAQSAEIDDLKGHVAELTHTLIDTRDAVSKMAQHMQELESELAAEPGEQTSTPPRPSADHMPALIEVLGKLANQRKPSGVKRTKDGMQLVYDDGENASPGPIVGSLAQLGDHLKVKETE